MGAPASVVGLVEKFRQERDFLRSAAVKEDLIRRAYLDPFFTALGWDVDYKKEGPLIHREVVQEDSLRVEGAMKAPDYAFRIGAERKFFVEAKKPSVNLYDGRAAAFQVRRYGWSAGLPLSIVSDFEEFGVYDTRVRPDPEDGASTARTMFMGYEEYSDRWDEIADLFSRDAVLSGSLEALGQEKARRGTNPVDKAFLAEIEGWRELLAKEIYKKNRWLSKRDLNYSVQMTIDRLVFLRICEDRGIEDYGRLEELLKAGEIYKELGQVFRDADRRYNSGLFHFRAEKDRKEKPDDFTLELEVEDGPLKKIIRRLYYPLSPYQFSVMPVEILGQVYEQFLGKVISITPRDSAVVEEKPEVRKAGGVFYTPAYIVDHIVGHTVGKLVEDKTPRQVSGLNIVDPACGSGSFLIGAYDYLLDWHRRWYVEDGPEKHRKVLYTGPGGEWRLVNEEKKRILKNNLYGVDIDPQAVEVTKLSLLLKVLEGETDQSITRQLAGMQDRALPDLDDNIKCGNSLIGSDFYDRPQMSLLGGEEQLRINAFDWEVEFSEIFKAGGFDAVIGNPPWGAEFTEPELAYHRRKNQEIIVRMIDSFMYFVYQNCERLRADGQFGMILPDVVLYQHDNQKLREYLMGSFQIGTVLNLGDVFDKVTRPACILTATKSPSTESVVKVKDVSGLSKGEKPVAIDSDLGVGTIGQSALLKMPGKPFITRNITQYAVWSTLIATPHRLLVDFIDDDGIQRGVSPDLKEAFILDSESVELHDLETTKLKRVLTGGRHVKRYHITYPDLWLIYTTRTDNFEEIPNIRNYIERFRDQITCKEVQANKHPLYSLHRPRAQRIFQKEKKLLGVITEDEIIVALDESQTYATDGLYLFSVEDDAYLNYLLAILNSKLFVFTYRLLALEKGRVLAQVKPSILGQLPIRTIDVENDDDRARYDAINSGVSDIQTLLERRRSARTPYERQVVERQLVVKDRRVDQLVYDLYGLTDEEIEMVEGG